MIYRRTDGTDTVQMKALFHDAFGDGEEELSAFFTEIYPNCDAFGAFDGKTLAAMVYCLPMTLVPSQKRAAYFYAVATAGNYRGRGICRGLLSFAEQSLKKQGVSCLLLACETEELAQMYRKMGFSGEPLGYELPPCVSRQKIDALTYGGMRETLLADVEHVRYSSAQLRFAERGTEFFALEGFGCASIRTCADGSRKLIEWLEAGKAPKAAPFMVKKLEDGVQTPYCAFAFD
ncbi:MAG: GNAT family N-acetyltransferase [Oscillospiraceae bacterium]|nr:GNAT family N-acetyltransferase [Oscillospiraceae bacterium]